MRLSGTSIAKQLTIIVYPLYTEALSCGGQIAILRRIAGCPMRGKNYYRAESPPGRVGPDHARRCASSDLKQFCSSCHAPLGV